MFFNAKVASAILLFTSGVLAAPVPQLAGEGAAANSILSGTDNAVGYGVEKYVLLSLSLCIHSSRKKLTDLKFVVHLITPPI
jgi:hypothetical protein